MCSVGWSLAQGQGLGRYDGYELFFNRDEQWSRPLSRDPGLVAGQVVPFLCAEDPQGGGTWLAVNSSGITVAVLNSYQGRLPKTKEELLSRGRLPLFAGLGRTAREIASLLALLDWSDYAPCHVLILAPGEKARIWLWDGEKLECDMEMTRQFFTTSSVDTAAICAEREARFDGMLDSPLEGIFDSMDLEKPAAGIFMTRTDAGTVSQTRVKVTARSITLAVRRRDEDFITVRSERIA